MEVPPSPASYRDDPLLMSSLAQFAAARSWRNVFKLSETAKPVPGSPAFFEVKRLRALALARLRMFKHAGEELHGVDLERAPFGLRLLAAGVASLQGGHQAALEQLCELEARAEREGRGEEAAAASLAQVAVLARQKDFVSALAVAERRRGREGDSFRVLSMMGQLSLELGDVGRAEKAFSESISAKGGSAEERAMNEGLLLVAKNDYEAALERFEAVLAMGETEMAVAATNNKAVCLLFTRRLGEAVALLEGRLMSKPGQFLEEVFVSNLCTLLDLHSEKPAEKKAEIAKLAAHSDGFDTSLIV